MPPDRQCQSEAHEIYRSKGLDVRLSLALVSSTIQIEHHRSPHPQFRHAGTEGEGNILQSLPLWFQLRLPTRLLNPLI
ncbi:hypothetical protein TNCV_4454121 [Trichonephila clavipes]|nr:hypothetical protein TNCV_4454121 [Trichonephila clavipes]